MTNPAYFALYARRRMDLYGATAEDFAAVKVKNARHGLDNPNARYRKEVTRRGRARQSAVVSDPLHLLDICATSDGAAAVVLTSMDYARQHGPRRPGAGPRDLDGHADLPADRHRHAAASRPTPAAGGAGPERTFKESIGHAAYEEAGIGPEDVDVAEVYDLVHRPRARLDRGPRAVQARRGRAAAARRRHHHRRPDPGQPVAAASPASARPCPPRRSPRSASSPGSCAARPRAVRSRAPGSGSPPTRASSATARR